MVSALYHEIKILLDSYQINVRRSIDRLAFIIRILIFDLFDVKVKDGQTRSFSYISWRLTSNASGKNENTYQLKTVLSFFYRWVVSLKKQFIEKSVYRGKERDKTGLYYIKSTFSTSTRLPKLPWQRHILFEAMGILMI